MTITPSLICQDATAAIAFYKAAFGAEEVMRLAYPNGKIGHAELRIGDALIEIADEHPDLHLRAPQAFGGSPVSISLLVPDVDAVVAKAVVAGATLTRPVADQFYGYRTGALTDPAGHRWRVSTVKEELSNAEIERRFDNLMKKSG